VRITSNPGETFLDRMIKLVEGASRQKTPNGDLVTPSRSGLGPDISPAAAEFRIPRVSRLRGMKEEDVRTLVQKHTKGRDLRFFGEPRVNVLELNLELDSRVKARE